MSCLQRIKCGALREEFGAASARKTGEGMGLYYSPPNYRPLKESRPGSSVCAHELYMGSIKTLNSWFLGNLPVRTTDLVGPLWLLIKTAALVIKVCGNVRSDHHKPASHRAIFRAISSLWRPTGPAADFLTWRRDALR